MERQYTTSAGILECFPNYALFTVHSEIISREAAKEVIKCTYDHYKNRKYVLISNRKKSYQVDSSAYKFINPKKIVGIALVSDDDNVKNDAMEKQLLYNGAFGFFATVEDAIDWAHTVVKAL